jgi:hypothetical protein
MNKYDTVIGWLENHWITTVILIILAVLIAIPQVRDGAVLLWTWAKHIFRKKQQGRPKVTQFCVMGETVSCTEILRSLTQDVVKIEAHTHTLGVTAEYQWISKEYPGSKTQKQRLTTLDMLKGNKKYSGKQIHFDVITILTKAGMQKDIYFDISSFFGSAGSSLTNPDGFIAQKIKELYGQK